MNDLVLEASWRAALQLFYRAFGVDSVVESRVASDAKDDITTM